jgi:hypothetical protein
MAMKLYASNGTVLIDGQTLIEALDIDYESSNAAKLMKPLSGQGGVAFGRSDVKGSFNFAVPRADTERLALIRKYQNQQGLRLAYRTAGIAMRADVVLTSIKLASKSDDADTFSADYIGFEEPVQQTAA